jgi:transposase
MALTNKQLKAVEMLVYTTKQKQEIAEELKVSNGTISQWLKKEEFQQAITDEMRRGFVDIAYKARRRLSDLVDSPNEQVALGAIREALNKAGYQETQKVEQTIREINIEITE